MDLNKSFSKKNYMQTMTRNEIRNMCIPGDDDGKYSDIQIFDMMDMFAKQQCMLFCNWVHEQGYWMNKAYNWKNAKGDDVLIKDLYEGFKDSLLVALTIGVFPKQNT